MVKNLAMIVATLGVGNLPKAPGTWGSLLALAAWLAFMPTDSTIQWISIFIAFFLGCLATHFYERFYQRHDPKEVVVDEVVGMWIALTVIDGPTIVGSFMAFLLFRLFDIWKPFPIGWMDRQVPGAFGTMVDDVAAGFMAMAVLQTGLSMGFLPDWAQF